jgi:hypothetical protein
MAISFTQTDTAAACGALVYCSSASLNGARSLKQATNGGTPGVTTITQQIDGGASNLIAVFFECIVETDTAWNAGTWTINLNVTSAESAIAWNRVNICRLSSGCTNQASIASVGGLDISLSTTGTKTASVSGSAQTPSAGDKVMVLLAFNNSTGADRSFDYRPNVTIDSPFSEISTPNSLMLVGIGT